MVEKNNPLVSIYVITYNSSKFVLETLESAKAQTYQNIELIVSDDCSTDNTVEICREWIEKNKDRFVRTELITAEKNTGIAANCNRAVKACRGEWVKGIAGDDILMDNCINRFIDFAEKSPNCEIIQSNLIPFKIDNNKKIYLSKSELEKERFYTDCFSNKNQYEYLLRNNVPLAPSTFIKRKAIVDVGFYNKKYSRFEDWPLWLELTKRNKLIYLITDVLVEYRIHEDSITRNRSGNIYSNHLQKYDFIFNEIYDKLTILEKSYINIEYSRIKLLTVLKLDKYNFLNRALNMITYKCNFFRYFYPSKRYRQKYLDYRNSL